MFEQAILWAFGILIGALFALIGFLAKIFWAKLSSIDNGALATFAARDAEREKAWWEWRKYLDEDRKFRHEEAVKRLDSHAAELRGMERRLTRLERNGHEPQSNRP